MSLAATPRSRQITGRMVLFGLIGFFGVVFAANAVMITFALTTFGGLETRNAYQAGLSFKNEIAAARTQETRHWEVPAKLSATGEGTRIDVAPKDASGAPLVGYEVSVAFEHPADRRRDREAVLPEFSPGEYRGVLDVPNGQWELVIEILQRGERVYRSRSRIVLR